MFLFVLGSHPYVNIIHCLTKWNNSEDSDGSDGGGGGDSDDGDDDDDDDDGRDDDDDHVTCLATRFWMTELNKLYSATFKSRNADHPKYLGNTYCVMTNPTGDRDTRANHKAPIS